MNPNATNPPTFFQSIRWPAIVVALLGGHVTLMMVAMTLSLAAPSPSVSESSYRDAIEWDSRRSSPTTESKRPGESGGTL